MPGRTLPHGDLLYWAHGLSELRYCHCALSKVYIYDIISSLCFYMYGLSVRILFCRSSVDLTKTKLCDVLLKHGICEKPQSRFAQFRKDLKATTDMYETSLCVFSFRNAL